MLELEKVVIENIGPFKGENPLRCESKQGVVIVRGINGRGKSHLLSAVRFALYGDFYDRSGVRKVDANKYLNRIARAEGEKKFSIRLSFKHDREAVELVRAWELGGSRSSFYVKLNGEVLSQAAARDFVRTMMPERALRFFLFDGELLRQYEDLLNDDSPYGEEIVKDIEQMLGVPTLLTLRDDLEHCLEEAKKAEVKAGKKHQKTEKLSKLIEQLFQGREKKVKSRNDLKEKKDDFTEQLREANELLKKQARVEDLISKRTFLDTEIKRLKEETRLDAASLSKHLANCWYWMVGPKLKTIRKEWLKQLQKQEKDYEHAMRDKIIGDLRAEAAKSGTCSICNNTNVKLETPKNKSGQADPRTKNNLTAKMEKLEGLLDKSSDSGGAVELDRQLARDRSTLSKNYADLKEINAQLDNSIIKEVKDAQRKHSVLTTQIRELERGIKTVNDEIKDDDKQIELHRKAIEKTGSFTKHADRIVLIEELLEGTSNAIDGYKDAMKKKVERDASELFLKMIHEPEYKRLQITPHYGMRILRDNDEPVDNRSSGEEHIVALALLGALRRNASSKGLLFIDSPFTRLDYLHTEQVLKTLPEFSEQIILFVFDKELPSELPAKCLKASLMSEYNLTKQSESLVTLEKVP